MGGGEEAFSIVGSPTKVKLHFSCATKSRSNQLLEGEMPGKVRGGEGPAVIRTRKTGGGAGPHVHKYSDNKRVKS